MKLQVAFFSVLLAGGCNAPVATPATNALTASAPAQEFGVGSYELADHGATLLDRGGGYMGTLFIAQPDDNTRSLRLDLVDGHYYWAEVTKRDAAGFVNAYKNEDILEAVQTDPALATMYAGYAMKFSTNVGQPVVDAKVAPSDIDLCDPPPNPVCRAFGCTTYYDTDIDTDSACQSTAYTTASCNTYCTNRGLYAVGPQSGIPCTSPPNFFFCECYQRSVKTSNHVSCPRISCSTVGDCDQVERVRTCLDPGACTRTGSGYLQCTTQLPGNPPGTCTQQGTIEKLTVTKTGAGSGTVTSDDGQINCGTGCVANELQGNVVQLTATPTAGSFNGWSGACTGTGTCSVTMSAAKTATANFCTTSGTQCGLSSGCTTQQSYNNCSACCSGSHNGTPYSCNGTGGTATPIICN